MGGVGHMGQHEMFGHVGTRETKHALLACGPRKRWQSCMQNKDKDKDNPTEPL